MALPTRSERRRRVDPGVAPTYAGDERPITRSDAEIRRRDAGIHSPSSPTDETVSATAERPSMRRVS